MDEIPERVNVNKRRIRLVPTCLWDRILKLIKLKPEWPTRLTTQGKIRKK